MAILINKETLQFEPDADKKIIGQFIDYKTNLLIIEEIFIDTSFDNNIYVTTVDTANANIIEVKDRWKYIDYRERIENHGDFKAIEQRIVNKISGNESIYGEIYNENNLIYSVTKEGFSKEKIEGVYYDYLQLKDEEQKEYEQLIIKYNSYSLDEKAKYWAGGLFKSMRWQEESRLNPYDIYSEKWLLDTLNIDSNFLELLPKIYNIWGGMFDANKVDNIIQKLLKKINDTKK
jgi:hypothetical protein